ncbi:MAG: cupin domain-containing protein [Acidobacteria bacterium]|nr:cupin domain-containing protein [Acidobacteriota bacterium]
MDLCDWEQLPAQEVTELYKRKIACLGSTMIARIEVMRGAVTEPHTHDTEEIVMVLEGAWRFFLPDGEVTIRENQMLSIPPGAEHASEALEDTVALDICTRRPDWLTGEDLFRHRHPDELLWAV